jgi:predicted esterase
MKALFVAITDGRFGPLDPHRWYAGGISSGGYMSSRMAVSYPGRFRALIVHSASYATCGPVCTVPALPPNHPPTLFLHGEQDMLAPPSAMRDYEAALLDAGVPTRAVVDPTRAHEWLPVAPDEVLGWVTMH